MAGDQSIKNEGDNTQNIQVGGDHYGDIIQSPPPPVPPSPPGAEFGPRKVRLLPITERWLQAISAVITIATAIGVANALRMFSHDFDAGVAPRLWPLYLVIGGVALSAVGWSAALFLRKRTSYFFPTALAPVLAGVTDRRGRGASR